MPSPASANPFPATRPDRRNEIAAFLQRVGWGSAQRTHLAGDASFRRYERVRDEARHAVLMDAPPPFEDVRPFIHVTALLGNAHLSAPRLIAQDAEEGFLLIEDLGDDSFSRVLRETPAHEELLYHGAMDALLHLQRHVRPEGIPAYDMAVYLREVSLFCDWFLPQVLGMEKARVLKPEYLALWEDILTEHTLAQTVMVHRDYHADNLLWLPARSGEARVGMIDYQDALLGDPLYDVVSLLEDARRDVSEETVLSALQRFVAGAGIEDARARRHYAILGAQRNLKIIGIFTRLAVRDGKQQYLAFLPRVWGHLERDLQHPVLSPLAAFIDRHVPSGARGVIAVDSALGALS